MAHFSPASLAGLSLANDPDALARVLYQPELPRLLPDLILSLQRKLAVSANVLPRAISVIRSLISISDQGSPEFASIAK
jgi:hypothetical protein